MNRTRLIFYVVLAVCLLILAGSVTQQVLSAEALLPIFVACTVFGMGVVALDFLGLLGHHGGDGAHGVADHGGMDAAHGGSHDGGLAGAHVGGLVNAADGSADTAADLAGFHDLAAHDVSGHDGGHLSHAAHVHLDGDHAAGHVGGHAHPHHDDEGRGQANRGSQGAPRATGENGHGLTTAGHLPGAQTTAQPTVTVIHGGPNPSPVLSMLAYLRLFVYFCLGFGPAGWIGLAFGRGPLASLVIATPFGVASLFLARAFFRFQRRDTGAVPPEADVLREQALVIVPCDDSTMGKVRVQAGMTVSDLYALAADQGAAYANGDTVRIVRVTDDCVYVR